MSFMTCDAARNVSVEIQAASQRIGEKLHLTLSSDPGKSAGDLFRNVSLPMFKDATTAADAAGSGAVIIITATGCDGLQSMKSTIDARRAVKSCQ